MTVTFMKLSFLTILSLVNYIHAFIPHVPSFQVQLHCSNIRASRGTFPSPTLFSSALFSVAQFQQSLEENPNNTILLDVREPDEWDQAHLSLANLSPLSSLNSGTYPIHNNTGETILKDANIFIHCKLGGRAKKAADVLKKMGYKNVVPLGESFEQLVSMGLCEVIS